MKFAALSLKNKITGLTLLLFIASIWLLVFVISSRLERDMAAQLESQQLAMAAYIADSIEGQVKYRIATLNATASDMTPEMMADSGKLLRHLKSHSLLQGLFQMGIVVISNEGIGLADFPSFPGRSGASFAKLEYFKELIATGKPVVGKPRIGRFSKKPVIGFVVPILDESGRRIGMLAGYSLLSDPALLGIIEHTDYKDFPDRLVVVSPKYSIFVSGSDETRFLQPTPAVGVNPLFDKFMAGFEGSGITVNSSGVRMLSSARQIPTPGWFVRVGIPTEIAFAPIQAMKTWAYIIALGLSLAISMVLWLVIRRALRPLYDASQMIQGVTEGRIPFKPIPVLRDDEVGQLLAGFNTHINARQAADNQIRRLNNLYNALSEVNQAIVRMEHEAQLFPLVCRCAVEYGGMKMAWVGQLDEASGRISPVASYGSGLEYLNLLNLSAHADVPEGRGPTGTALRENHPVVINDYLVSAITAPWQGYAVQYGWNSAAAFPVSRAGKPFAVLSVYHEERDAFDDKAIILLKEMTEDISFALDNFDREIQRQAAQEKAQYLANYDPLTNMPNRTLLQDRVKIALAAAERAEGYVALMHIDINRFRNVNDSLGHSGGDRLLQELARRIAGRLHRDDSLSRHGGDEFILLLPNTDTRGATRVASKILKTISEPFNIGGQQISLTASIGIAEYPENGASFELLAQCADSALSRAKQQGPNNFQFFAPELHQHASEVLRIENDLRLALKNNQLLLYYQPQVDAVSSRIIGAEALIRWQHPERGMIFPGKFISVAENSGQILEIGDWVLRTAAQQNADWQAAGLGIVPVAINLSLAQFRLPTLCDTVRDALHQTGLDPAMLQLELTESIAMENSAFTIDMVDKLHALGVALSIDDFGTGYSSLSYLKRFRIRKLKIDQSFVRELVHDADDEAIVIAIIGLAKSLGLKTIAEGVESQEQLDFLRQQRCDEIQGYFYSKPIPAEKFALLLANGGKIQGATFRD